MNRSAICLAVAIIVVGGVRPALGQATSFGAGASANEDWTHGPYYAERGMFFADVDGDGRADAIVVNNDTVTVRRSNGVSFNPGEDWTHGPYYGERKTFFADVDGDGKADAIVVNDDTVVVRRSTATCFLFCWDYRFGPNEDWTHGPFFGQDGTFFADMDGDRRVDAVVINGGSITVRRSTGSGFGAAEDWSCGRGADRWTFFMDIDSDRKADLVTVSPSGDIGIFLSVGSRCAGLGTLFLDGFSPVAPISRNLQMATMEAWFVRRALMIAVQESGVWVADPWQQVGFSNWTGNAFYGSRGTFFADVTGDGQADAIAVNDNTVIVRRAVP